VPFIIDFTNPITSISSKSNSISSSSSSNGNNGSSCNGSSSGSSGSAFAGLPPTFQRLPEELVQIILSEISIPLPPGTPASESACTNNVHIGHPTVRKGMKIYRYDDQITPQAKKKVGEVLQVLYLPNINVVLGVARISIDALSMPVPTPTPSSTPLAADDCDSPASGVSSVNSGGSGGSDTLFVEDEPSSTSTSDTDADTESANVDKSKDGDVDDPTRMQITIQPFRPPWFTI
jgi:hypothetical protein